MLVQAPWTREQVDRLMQWQCSEFTHPFTCKHDSSHLLVPTVRGWICQFDDYTQEWAHDFMLAFTGDGDFVITELITGEEPKK